MNILILILAAIGALCLLKGALGLPGFIVATAVIYLVLRKLWGVILRHKKLTVALVLLALFAAFGVDGLYGIGILLVLGAFWYGVFWFLGQVLGFRVPGSRGRTSFRSKVSRSMSDTINEGISNILIPKPPTQADLDARRRAEARKAYDFHNDKAKRYDGTLDGEYHKARAREAWERMK